MSLYPIPLVEMHIVSLAQMSQQVAKLFIFNNTQLATLQLCIYSTCDCGFHISYYISYIHRLMSCVSYNICIAGYIVYGMTISSTLWLLHNSTVNPVALRLWIFVGIVVAIRQPIHAHVITMYYMCKPIAMQLQVGIIIIINV